MHKQPKEYIIKKVEKNNLDKEIKKEALLTTAGIALAISILTTEGYLFDCELLENVSGVFAIGISVTNGLSLVKNICKKVLTQNTISEETLIDKPKQYSKGSKY